MSVESGPSSTDPIDIDAEALIAAFLGRTGGIPLAATAHGLRNTAPLRVRGDVDLTNIEAPIPVELSGCIFDGDLDVSGATFRKLSLTSCVLKCIRGDGLRVDRNFDLSGSTVLECLTLRNLVVKGDVRFNGTHILGKDSDGVSLRAAMARIDAGLLFEVQDKRRFESAGEVRFTGSRIDGLVRFRGAAVTANGIRFDRAKIGGRLFFDSNASFHPDVTGEVDFSHAELGGGVAMLGGAFRSSAIALNFEGARCVGPLIMGEDDLSNASERKEPPLKVDGDVSLNNSRIDGDWICDDRAAFRSILARGMRIEGALVHYPTVKIGGVLDLRGANVKIMIDARAAWPTRGNLLLDLLTYESFAAKFPREEAKTPAKVEERLAWLDLQPAECRHRELTAQPYVQLARVIGAAGHRELARDVLYQLEVHRLGRDRRWTAWLLVLLLAVGCFAFAFPDLLSRSPIPPSWQASLAGGPFVVAVVVEAFHWIFRRTKPTPAEWLCRCLVGATAGFGFKPFRALYGLLLLWIAGAVVLDQANELGLVYPNITRAIPIVGRNVPPANEPTRSLPTFGALSYSADLTFPLWSLLQKEAFVVFSERRAPESAPWPLSPVATQPDAPELCDAASADYVQCRLQQGFVGTWIIVQMTMGWVLTTIAVAGFGGLLRPREE